MEQSRGRIISVADDRSRATVEVDTAVFCSRCASGKGCGAGIFGSDRGPRRLDAPVVGHLELREGDEVQIELAPQSVLHAALLVYGIPLAVTVAMAGIAYVARLSDAEAVLAVIAGIAVGGFISRWRLRRSNCLRQFTPAITGRLGGAE
jgi:sigma-E factor negative regulatory protein RseC